MAVVRKARVAGALFGGRTAKPTKLEDPEVSRADRCKGVGKE